MGFIVFKEDFVILNLFYLLALVFDSKMYYVSVAIFDAPLLPGLRFIKCLSFNYLRLLSAAVIKLFSGGVIEWPISSKCQQTGIFPLFAQ